MMEIELHHSSLELFLFSSPIFGTLSLASICIMITTEMTEAKTSLLVNVYSLLLPFLKYL